MGSHMDTYALKAVTDLPAPFRSAFSFRYFNSLQSECFSTCYLSDVNMVISAPTGSGKTVLFELCIMRLLSKFINGDGNFTHHKGTLKTIYIAPSKALVQEKVRDWSQKLGPLGINCLELTGDNEHYSIKNIQDADIILTTPEKFDAVTRYRITDGGLSFFSDIALVLIDEVHLLNDPRGAALEAIVSRIKMLARNPEMKSSSLSLVRLLAVSATIPNINDLAEWLMAPTQGIKRFGEEMRPVKLTTKVFGYTPAKNDFLFEKRLQNYIFDLLMQFSGGKSALIFCSTRKGAQEAAQRLSQIAMTFGHSSPFIKSREQQERLREASLSCSDKQMQSYILYGVGYHNGGLSLKDRNLIEGLFLNGDLQILCTTNTLAHGINLPAHTVVIKSTQYFNKEKGIYMEYERSMVLQMCGRAGRPPFDDTGMVIIMTRKETKVNELSQYQMVWTDEDGFLLKPLVPGKLMTKYYLKFDTMKHIIQAPANCSIEDTLHIICRAEEISWIQLRRNEKKLLNDINNDRDGRLRFHILDNKGKRKKRIQTREEKIFILANDCLTGDPLVHDLSMSQDMNSISTNGSRIAKCMKEYFVYKKSYRGALNSTLLAKCLHQKLWEDSPYLLKQLPGIGMVTAKALHSMGVMSFDSLLEADSRKIELVTGRKYPFGNHIKDSLLSLPPKIEMVVTETRGQRMGKSKLLITLTRLSQTVQSTNKKHYADMMVGIEEDNIILFYEKIRLEDFSSPYCATVLYSSPQIGMLTIKADLIHEEFIGIDLHEKVIITPPLDLKVTHKHRPKELSSFHPKDVHIIKDSVDRTSRAATNELIENSISMPSFKLIDEESEDDMPVVETEDDDCKIITEKTVFDHIRTKAKSLPVLPLSNYTPSPSLEAFTRIRKRTREMHLELDNSIEVSEVQESSKTPRSIRYHEFTEPELDMHTIIGPPDNNSYQIDTEIWSAEGMLATEHHQNNESRILTEEAILRHVRKFEAQESCKVPRNTQYHEFTEPEQNMHITCPPDDLFDPMKDADTLATERQNFESGTLTEETILQHDKVPFVCVSMTKNDIQCPVISSSESKVKKLLSPSLHKRQFCSLEVPGEVKKENPFRGFQSVFSFL
ncbi:probable ATP-dependent DNA helicase hfm1 [Phtheirospermum japonicum]|uniref:DNA 3'-5' helicase n=1 Tax=Phtheirospermum japonicum TaxID=374723 RepID=A0A830CKK3_9LAMI|nr:probable ATP-dependent DNA helicase hfm1 [Phtheirospermum japonicum]